MTEHISDELPRLLTGEASRDLVMTAAAHLRTCPDCQQELVSAVIAHASLMSARRFAPEVVAAAPDLPTASAERAGEIEAEHQNPSAPLPDLTGVFAQARQDATAAQKAPARSRRRLAALGAAAAIVVGGGIAGGLVATSGDSNSGTHTVQLSAFPNPTRPTSAKITLAGNRLHMDATKLPPLGPTRIYELWATNAARTKMQSLATMNGHTSADLTVPSTVLSKFSDFEVSVQPVNQVAKYSGVSVVRGSYR